MFGSFARGDFHDKSDIDIAFFKLGSPNKWAQFKNWINDNFKTLRDVDIVNGDSAEEQLIQSILSEGKVIYDK